MLGKRGSQNTIPETIPLARDMPGSSLVSQDTYYSGIHGLPTVAFLGFTYGRGMLTEAAKSCEFAQHTENILL